MSCSKTLQLSCISVREEDLRTYSFVFEAESSRWNLATDQLSRLSCIIIGSIVIWPEVYSHCSRARERIQEPTLDFRRMLWL